MRHLTQQTAPIRAGPYSSASTKCRSNVAAIRGHSVDFAAALPDVDRMASAPFLRGYQLDPPFAQ
jgi:hypothetical protein